MSEEDEEEYTKVFGDMLMHGMGMARVTEDGVKHVPQEDILKSKDDKDVVVINNI